MGKTKGIEQMKTRESKEQQVESLLHRIQSRLASLEKNIENNVAISPEQKKDFTEFVQSLDATGLSSLTDQDKLDVKSLTQKLTSGESNLDKHDISVLSRLVESVANTHLEGLDVAKTTDLEQASRTFDTNLNSLLGDVTNAPNLSPEAMKKKAIEERKTKTHEAVTAMIEEKKKKWYGRLVFDWLGLETYLRQTYVDGKTPPTWKKYVYGGILAIIGGGALKKSLADINATFKSAIGNIPNIDKPTLPAVDAPEPSNDENLIAGAEDAKDDVVEDVIAGAEDVKEEVNGALETERERIVNAVIMPAYKDQIESATGKKFDDETFSRIFKERWAENKEMVASHVDHLRDEYDKQSRNEEMFHTSRNIITTLSLPAKSAGNLIKKCMDAGMFTAKDVVVTSVVDRGKTLYTYALRGGTFVGSTAMTLSGNMSLDELAASLGEVNFSPNERMVLWGALYRYGGAVTNFVAGLGRMNAYLLSGVLGGVSLDEFNAYWKGGMSLHLDTQISAIDKWEDAMSKGGLFEGVVGDKAGAASYCKDVKSHLKFSAYATRFSTKSIGHGKADFLEFEKQMKAAGFAEEMKKFRLDQGLDGPNGLAKMESSNFNFKNAVATHIENVTNTHISSIDRKRWQRFGDQAMEGFAISKAKFRAEFTEQLRHIGKTYSSLCKAGVLDAIVPGWHALKRKKLATTLAEMTNWTQKASFYMETPQDAKKFFEQMDYLIEKSPEAAASLLKAAPVLLVGAEVRTTLKNEPESDLTLTITRGMANLMPIVGSLWLVGDSMSFQEDTPVNYKGITMGAMMMTYDGWILANARSSKEILQQFAHPFTSTGGLARDMAYGSYTTLKHSKRALGLIAKDMAERGVLKGLVAGKMAREGYKFLGKASLRATLLVGMISGGYYGISSLWESIAGNKKKQEQFRFIQEELQGKEVMITHRKLLDKMNSIEDKAERQEFLKMWMQIALRMRFGLNDPASVEVGLIDGDKISFNMKELIPADQREIVKQEFTPLLKEILGRDVTVDFYMHPTLRNGSKELLKEQLGDDATSDKLKKAYTDMLKMNGESDEKIREVVDGMTF